MASEAPAVPLDPTEAKQDEDVRAVAGVRINPSDNAFNAFDHAFRSMSTAAELRPDEAVDKRFEDMLRILDQIEDVDSGVPMIDNDEIEPFFEMGQGIC